MKTGQIYLIILLVCIIGVGCNNQTKTNAKLTTITVSKQPLTDTLYLNGIIEPITIISVVAPFDGTIINKAFEYGAVLKKNQLLLTLDSSAFNDNFQEALTNYLKAKQDYANSESKLQSSEELNRLGIISRNDFQSDQNQVYNSSLALVQATHKIEEVLKKANNISMNLTQLNIENSKVVNDAFLSNFEKLKIYSPNNGIALLPIKTSSSDDDNNKPLNVGDQVKAGQSLLTVGDISGIILSVKINEIHINNIKTGQTAIITSDAFSDTLHGQVIQVDQQAIQDDEAGTPCFSVKIVVPKISEAQRKVIHIGMSVKVALEITKDAAIQIPIAAVINKNGQTSVKILTKDSNKIIEMPVVTGYTSLETVEIKQGLQPGDKVIINVNH